MTGVRAVAVTAPKRNHEMTKRNATKRNTSKKTTTKPVVLEAPATPELPAPPTTRTAEAPYAPTPTLHRYEDGTELRDATPAELAASVEAARHDGGAGIIEADGVRCYVDGPEPLISWRELQVSGGAS
jgi:hypothetical protein